MIQWFGFVKFDIRSASDPDDARAYLAEGYGTIGEVASKEIDLFIRFNSRSQGERLHMILDCERRKQKAEREALENDDRHDDYDGR